MRTTEFANEEYYHIFNRGVDKRKVFLCKADYERFLISLLLLNTTEGRLMEKWRDFKKFNPKAKLKDFLNYQKIDLADKLVEILCFCQNPNHYHLILKQLKDRGVELFMHKLGTSHTKFFNKKNDRSGSLFQGPFKSVHISSNNQLLYLSAYVNMNYYIHGYEKSLSDALGAWMYSSLPDYLGERNENFCNTKIILDQFRNVAEYKKYMENNAKHFKEKKEMEKYWLE
ncbi:MAG: transposase [Parcubacteria group bacterium]|jgi:putative transposase